MTSDDHADAENPGNTDVMMPRQIRYAIVGNAVSILLIVWMFVGGLVTFMPTNSGSTIQNFYLDRIFSCGSCVIMVQLVSIALLVSFYRSERDGKSLS